MTTTDTRRPHWLFAIGDLIIKTGVVFFLLCIAATYAMFIAFATAAIGPVGVPVGFVVCTFFILTHWGRSGRRGKR